MSNEKNNLWWEEQITGLLEIGPGVAHLQASDDPDLDVPEQPRGLGLTWAGEVTYEVESAVQPHFEDKYPVYQLRDGSYAIVKDGEIIEVEVTYEVKVTLMP